jgi:GTP-binding protein
MPNFKNTQFIKSCLSLDDRPLPHRQEVVFLGRSNVGKSSLLNNLTSQHQLAKVSSKPGKTIFLNYFDVDQSFYLVDAPGYGYSSKGTRDYPRFATMMESYLTENEYLKLIILLVDARHPFSDDDQHMINFLSAHHVAYLIVNTKYDKLNQKEKAALSKRLNENNIDEQNVFFTTLNFDKQLEKLRWRIIASIS